MVRVGATSKALSADNRQCLDPATHQSISRHQPPLVQATQALRIAESWSHCTLKLDARDCSGESAAIRIFKIQGATEFERDNFLHEVTVTKTSRTSLTESWIQEWYLGFLRTEMRMSWQIGNWQADYMYIAYKIKNWNKSRFFKNKAN